MAVSRTKGKGKANGMLARRKAALERAASRVAEQRRTAAEAEAERLRKEAAFDELAADFELAVEDEQSVAAEVEEELRRVRERGQVRIDAARVKAARVVLAMGEAGETVAGCGQRLGVGVERVKELRRLGREALSGEGAGAESGEAAAAGGEQRGGVRAAGPAGAGAVAAPLVAPPPPPPPAVAASPGSPGRF
ncbi:hypothetical protein [Streptomyces sp. NPDC015350]|uniref:hypothetical protein n=1 Tax=Streptomyces sp. NPDC015350 TaxID=3364955 RepID=UPI0036FBE261